MKITKLKDALVYPIDRPSKRVCKVGIHTGPQIGGAPKLKYRYRFVYPSVTLSTSIRQVLKYFEDKPSN